MANNQKVGIYRITNSVNGKHYVGSTSAMRTRWSQHRAQLRRGDHHCTHLQNAWNKYGEASFEFVIIEECEVGQLLEREQVHLDAMGEYNTLRIAGSPRGYKHSQETIDRLTGREVSKETRAKLSELAKARDFGAIRRGATQTPETRAKMSEAKKGNRGRTGIPHSEESKERIAAPQRGRTFTPEHREKLRLAWERRRACAEVI